jgi:hypothetical protein
VGLGKEVPSNLRRINPGQVCMRKFHPDDQLLNTCTNLRPRRRLESTTRAKEGLSPDRIISLHSEALADGTGTPSRGGRETFTAGSSEEEAWHPEWLWG